MIACQAPEHSCRVLFPQGSDLLDYIFHICSPGHACMQPLSLRTAGLPAVSKLSHSCYEQNSNGETLRNPLCLNFVDLEGVRFHYMILKILDLVY